MSKALKPPNHDRTLYQAACTNALLNRPRRAVTLLAQAIQAGYKADKLATDPDLESIRNMDDFQTIMRAYFLGNPNRLQQNLLPNSDPTILHFVLKQFATLKSPTNVIQRPTPSNSSDRPRIARAPSLLAAFGTPWPEPRDLTISFPADGVEVGTYSNDIRDTLDQVADRQQWEELALRAFQTWSIHADINVGLRNDYDLDFGTPGLAVGDPRFGDFRIGAFPQIGLVASSVPFQTDAGTYSGDLLLNSNEQFKYHDWEDGVAPDPSTLGPDDRDLFSILLHETGNTLGIGRQPDGLVRDVPPIHGAQGSPHTTGHRRHSSSLRSTNRSVRTDRQRTIASGNADPGPDWI